MFVSVMATINMQIQASGFINYSPEFPQACQTPPRLRNILPILRSQSVLLGSWVQQTSSVHTQEDVTGGRQWWGSWQLTLLHELYEPNQTMHHECFMFHVQFSVTNHFWIFEDTVSSGGIQALCLCVHSCMPKCSFGHIPDGMLPSYG